MDNVSILDKVLLSYNAVKDFHEVYNTSPSFKDWLDEILPEVEECKNQKQDNPWHLYNVLDHILHSVEEMNKLTIDLPKHDRRILAYTMFFHDIGKPAKHIKRIKDGKLIDSFIDHNKESAFVAEDTLAAFNFTDSQINIISTLVYKHDIFMFIKDKPTSNPFWRTLSPRVINEEIEDLNQVGDGAKLLSFLILVGRADSLAQNPSLAKDSLNLLDKFEELFRNIQEKGN